MAPKKDKTKDKRRKQESLTEEQVKENLAHIEAQGPMEDFAGIEDIYDDSTNPSAVKIKMMGMTLLGHPPNLDPEPVAAKEPDQTRNDIIRLIDMASARIGCMYQGAHVEDLVNMSRNEGALSEKEINIYLRGVMRTNQISAITTLQSLVTTIDGILKSTHSANQVVLSSNKDLDEKLARALQKIDSVIPAIEQSIMQEHSVTRGKIEKLAEYKIANVTTLKQAIVDTSDKMIPDPSKALPNVLVTASTSKSSTQSYVSAEEIRVICMIANCPTHLIDILSTKFSGKVTLEEYNSIVSGKVSVANVKKMMKSWESRA